MTRTLVIALITTIGFLMHSLSEMSETRRSVHRIDLSEIESATGEPESDEIREPLFPSDEHLRTRITDMLAIATRRLPDVLAKSSATNVGNSNLPPESATHWSFKRLQKVEIPKVPDRVEIRNPIDNFIYAGLDALDLEFTQPASNERLRRRLAYDVCGLPHTELNAFSENDASEYRWQSVIDALLQDDAFGEHWARMWLDIARFADSDGYESDDLRPTAYTFRDFVIWAMNNDLPYDRFIQWQIAGDEIVSDSPVAHAATGFLTAAPHNTFVPQESERYDELHDIISTIGSGMLGVSIGCARCHDHEYDPITTEEYYRFVSVFESFERSERYLLHDGKDIQYAELARELVHREDAVTKMLEARIRDNKISQLEMTDQEKALLRKEIDPNNARQAELLARCGGCVRVDGSDFVDNLQPLHEDAYEYQRITSEIAEIKRTLPFAPAKGLVATGSEVIETHVQDGGSLKAKLGKVGPGFLASLTPGTDRWDNGQWKRWLPHALDRCKTQGRPRSALAMWMTDVHTGAGSLLARVIVNRIWQGYFGKGIVRTPNDFGLQGETPSHPELLDWLASELIAHEWSLKHIHRLVLTSRTYQQDSRAGERQLAADPSNRMCSRYRRKRLTAEMYRDSVLSAAGNLNRVMYGPGVYPPIPDEAIHTDDHELDTKWPAGIEESWDVWRRSVYVILRRSNTVPMLDLLDGSDGGVCQGKRSVTIAPVQSLALMNSPFIRMQANACADHIGRESRDLGEQIDSLYWNALGRLPSKQERGMIYRIIDRRRDEEDAYDSEVMTDVSHVVFMSNEFMYLD